MKNRDLERKVALQHDIRRNRLAQEADLAEVAKLNQRINTRRQQLMRDEAELATL